ncbi:MAG: hypothetical protein UHN47_09685 [Lachnospiraceae bacterium]|nr:hypothetical protein [Lachnospiraceae bacterium]
MVLITISRILASFTFSCSEDYDMSTAVYRMTYVYSAIGTWIVSTGVNRMLSSKVKTICMVDALKGVE